MAEQPPSWLLGCVAGAMYSVEMYIAEQGPFRMQFDTGSASIGIISTLCSRDSTDCPADLGSGLNVSEALRAGQLVGPRGNTTMIYSDETGISGPLYSANVSLGLYDPSPYSPSSHGALVNSTIIVIQNVTNGFFNTSSCPFDSRVPLDANQGIVGFGYPYILTGHGDTEFFVDWQMQYPAASPEFTVQLCPMDGSRLWMGWFDRNSTTTDGVFECVPVIGQQFWKVQACGLTLTSHLYNSTTRLATMDDMGGVCQADRMLSCAMFDSGGPMIYLPAAVFDAFVVALRADPFYVAAFGREQDPYDPTLPPGSCASSSLSPAVLRAVLPALNLLLGSAPLVAGVNGSCASNITLPILGVDGYLSRFSQPDSGGKTLCCATAATLVDPFYIAPSSVFGDTFMQRYTLRHVWDKVDPQLCFAPSKGCPAEDEHTGSGMD